MGEEEKGREEGGRREGRGISQLDLVLAKLMTSILNLITHDKLSLIPMIPDNLSLITSEIDFKQFC